MNRIVKGKDAGCIFVNFYQGEVKNFLALHLFFFYKKTVYKNIQAEIPQTRPDTRHKMRLVRELFTFENNTGRTYGPTDGRTDRRTDGRTQPHIEMRRRI